MFWTFRGTLPCLFTIIGGNSQTVGLVGRYNFSPSMEWQALNFQANLPKVSPN